MNVIQYFRWVGFEGDEDEVKLEGWSVSGKQLFSPEEEVTSNERPWSKNFIILRMKTSSRGRKDRKHGFKFQPRKQKDRNEDLHHPPTKSPSLTYTQLKQDYLTKSKWIIKQELLRPTSSFPWIILYTHSIFILGRIFLIPERSRDPSDLFILWSGNIPQNKVPGRTWWRRGKSKILKKDE